MYRELEKYLSCGVYPFHMPGHKRNADFFPPDLFRLDLTELPETDVLSAPGGMIKGLQEKIARFYGAGESFFLVNGSSAGVVAAVCACAGADVFVPRNAHVSAVNGLVLSGAMPAWYLPEITTDGLAGGVLPEVFDALPRGAVALVVSPTYDGFVSDISAIAAKVHSRGGVLIVDEAHGAHLAFHDYFPAHAVACGADIVISSFHKTLPMLSGCAVLHVNSSRVDVARLRFFINALQTTSPSFLMMAHCDFVLEKLWAEPKLFEKYAARLEKTRQCENTQLIGREAIGTHAIFDIDPGKLIFRTNAEAAEIAAHDYGIQFEYAAERHLLAMTSVADTDEGFARLARFFKNLKNGEDSTLTKIKSRLILPEIAMSPREAMARSSEEIPVDAAVGRISAELIADCPPGIALLVPGEKITEKISATISKPTVTVIAQKTD